jgi:hypothetical protein
MPHGDKTSANTVGPTIDPDEAEQLASSFVPVWRFHEAPFSAARALSNEDIEALAALAATASGTTPSTRPTAPPPFAPADVPLSTTQSFVALEADPFARVRGEDEATPPPESAALEAPVVAVAAGAPAAAKPAPELYGFEEPKVVRGPSRVLLLGAGAGVGAILALLAVTLHRTESPAESTVAVQISQAPESNPIPPPPPLPDPIEPPLSAAPTLNASRPEPPAAPAPPQRASANPAPARPRSASPPTKSFPEPGPTKSNAKPTPTVAVPDFGI